MQRRQKRSWLTPLLAFPLLLLAAAANAQDDAELAEVAAPTAAPAEVAEPAGPSLVEEAPAAAAPPEPPSPLAKPEERASQRVAVLDLRAAEPEGPLANALAAVLTAELARRPGYVAISRNEVRAVLEQQAAAALLGCETDKCVADLAGLLAVDWIVTGAVDAVDGALLVSISLIAPDGRQATRRAELTWRGAAAEVVTAAAPTVDRLLLGAGADALRGELRVLAPAGARVSLDDKELGAAPLAGPLADLPIGVHDVLVSKAGHRDARVSAVVTAGESSTLNVVLEPLPFYEQPWFWGTAAAATAGVVLTAVSVTGFVLASSVPLPAKVIQVEAGLPAAVHGLAASEGGR